MDERVSTRDLIAALRRCGAVGGGCSGCPFEGSDRGEGGCCDVLVITAADRLEEYVERCAHYADEAMHRSVMLPRGGEGGC